MFLQMRMSPAGADPQQQKMMAIMMPIMFTGFSLFLPAGLAIYTLTNSLLAILHQVVVNRIDKHSGGGRKAGAEPKARRVQRAPRQAVARFRPEATMGTLENLSALTEELRGTRERLEAVADRAAALRGGWRTTGPTIVSLDKLAQERHPPDPRAQEPQAPSASRARRRRWGPTPGRSASSTKRVDGRAPLSPCASGSTSIRSSRTSSPSRPAAVRGAGGGAAGGRAGVGRGLVPDGPGPGRAGRALRRGGDPARARGARPTRTARRPGLPQVRERVRQHVGRSAAAVRRRGGCGGSS